MLTEKITPKKTILLKLQVIPPGMDFSSVVVQEDDEDAASGVAEGSPKAVPTICADVSSFLPSYACASMCCVSMHALVRACMLVYLYCLIPMVTRGHSCRFCDSLQIHTSQ